MVGISGAIVSQQFDNGEHAGSREFDDDDEAIRSLPLQVVRQQLSDQFQFVLDILRNLIAMSPVIRQGLKWKKPASLRFAPA
jgi:hypothetical protein